MEVNVSVDLRDRFGEIRYQGKRPTCMAFASSDAHSFARDSTEPLSVEYGFFHAVRLKAKPDRTQGVGIRLMSRALSNDGQPLETGWPYLIDLSATDDWEVPKSPGTLFRRHIKLSIPPTTASIYASLDSGRPVILVIDISESFLRVTAGTILKAPADEPRLNTHAVVAVGYGESGGTRCMLIRNSWGRKWCDGGYAWVQEDYLAPRLHDAGTMD
jgi:hypothetical protein